MTPTDIEADILVFLDQDLNDKVQCDWTEECPNEPAWFVKCGICRKAEVICSIHRMELSEVMRTEPNFTFVFNHTCGHTVQAKLCKIEPM